jgi:hypothetical protein
MSVKFWAVATAATRRKIIVATWLLLVEGIESFRVSDALGGALFMISPSPIKVCKILEVETLAWYFGID